MSTAPLGNGLSAPADFVDKTEMAYLASCLAANKIRSPYFQQPDAMPISLAGGRLSPGEPAALLVNLLSSICRRPWSALELQIGWKRNDIRIQARALYHENEDDAREDPLPISDLIAQSSFALRDRYCRDRSQDGGLRLTVAADDRFEIQYLQPRERALAAAEKAVVVVDAMTSRLLPAP